MRILSASEKSTPEVCCPSRKVVSNKYRRSAISVFPSRFQTGDRLIIDAANRRIDHDISAAELARRKEGWAPPPPRVTRGVLANYYKSVASPKHGCVTDMI